MLSENLKALVFFLVECIVLLNQLNFKETDMKKLNRILFSILFASLVLPFASCGDDEEEDDTPKASLPTSVGENIFSGKTFTYEDEHENVSTLKFKESTVVFTEEDDDGTYEKTYQYSYDTEKSILYLAFQSISGTEAGEAFSLSNADEYVAYRKKELESEGVELTEDYLLFLSEDGKDWFSGNVDEYKYEITGDVISLEDYFDGNLPTECKFYSADGSVRVSDKIKLDVLEHGDSAVYECFRTVNCSYSDGKFSGNIYGEFNHDDGYKLLGKVEGTYSTSGTGTEGSGCTVKLTFTAIPDEVASASGVAKGTEYTLTF